MANNSPLPFVLLTFSAHHLKGSLDPFASNEPLSLVLAELFSTASATTFSLEAKLYEEGQAFWHDCLRYRKRPCISRTFFHKIEAQNQGCGLSTDTSVFGVLKHPN